MSSKSVSRWRISRIRGSRADQLGVVKAPTAQAAVKVAIKEFGVTEPEQQKRPAARPAE